MNHFRQIAIALTMLFALTCSLALRSPALRVEAARVCDSCCENCYTYGWATYDTAYAGYLETAILMHGGYPGPNDECWDTIYNLAMEDAQATYSSCISNCLSHCSPYLN